MDIPAPAPGAGSCAHQPVRPSGFEGVELQAASSACSCRQLPGKRPAANCRAIWTRIGITSVLAARATSLPSSRLNAASYFLASSREAPRVGQESLRQANGVETVLPFHVTVSWPVT